MDTFLYNKILTNIDRLNEKIKKINKKIQSGGVPIPVPVPYPGSPPTEQLSLSKNEEAYYANFRYGLKYDEENMRGFKDKYLTGALETFSQRIKKMSELIENMNLDKGITSKMTPEQFSEIKKLYMDFITTFNTKVMDQSLFGLDPDKYPTLFYKDLHKLDEFNEDLKKVFHLFIENMSGITDSNKFNEKLEENIKEIELIKKKCDEFNGILDNANIKIDNEIAFNANNYICDTNVFISGDRAKTISEYEYTTLINYDGKIDEVLTNSSKYNNFLNLL